MCDITIGSLILVFFIVLAVLISRHDLILIFSPRQFRAPKVELVVAYVRAAAIDFSPVEPNRIRPHEAVFLLLNLMVLLLPARKRANGLLLLSNELAVQVVSVDKVELLLVMLGPV